MKDFNLNFLEKEVGTMTCAGWLLLMDMIV